MALGLGLMSFKSETLKKAQNPCGEYADNSMNAEAAYYGYDVNSWDAFVAYDYYFNLCEDNGGADQMLAPVFL